jgi:hypothetical protein
MCPALQGDSPTLYRSSRNFLWLDLTLQVSRLPVSKKTYPFCEILSLPCVFIQGGEISVYSLSIPENIFCLLLTSCWFLASFIIRPWRWRRHVPPKRRLIFNKLHGVISQKIELFMTTGGRTLIPTHSSALCRCNSVFPGYSSASIFNNVIRLIKSYNLWQCLSNFIIKTDDPVVFLWALLILFYYAHAIINSKCYSGIKISALLSWYLILREEHRLRVKSIILSDITSCSPLNINRRFGGTYSLLRQGRRISQKRNQRQSRWQAELALYPRR